MNAGRTLLLAVAIGVAGPAGAQIVTDDNVAELEAGIHAQCMREMGYTAAECSCLNETVPTRLSPLQLEYIVARSSRNATEIQRMNALVGVFQRLDIFLTVRNVARACAPGKPFNLPDSGGDAAERLVRP